MYILIDHDIYFRTENGEEEYIGVRRAVDELNRMEAALISSLPFNEKMLNDICEYIKDNDEKDKEIARLKIDINRIIGSMAMAIKQARNQAFEEAAKVVNSATNLVEALHRIRALKEENENG